MANELEPTELSTLPQDILDLDEWLIFGQRTGKAAAYQIKMYQYIRALCSTVKKQGTEIKELQQKLTDFELKNAQNHRTT